MIDVSSEKAVSAILTQPDDDGIHNLIAYESGKLMAAVQACPAHVLVFFAVVRVTCTYFATTCSEARSRSLVSV